MTWGDNFERWKPKNTVHFQQLLMRLLTFEDPVIDMNLNIIILCLFFIIKDMSRQKSQKKIIWIERTGTGWEKTRDSRDSRRPQIVTVIRVGTVEHPCKWRKRNQQSIIKTRDSTILLDAYLLQTYNWALRCWRMEKRRDLKEILDDPLMRIERMKVRNLVAVWSMIEKLEEDLSVSVFV